jgi:hypothetical protein
MISLPVLLVLLQIATLLLPVRKSSPGNNLGCLEVEHLCKDRRLVMFGQMMDFAKIARCWDWRFVNVECVLVRALCHLFAVVLKLEVESHNVVAGSVFALEKLVLGVHRMMRTGQLQRCILELVQVRMEIVQRRW